MSRHPTPTANPTLAARRARGFSVIELMVSVVIGMLALMFATRLIVGSEQNKQASLGGSDSMQNGMLALFSIDADAAQAGYGLNDPIIAGCNTVFTDTGGYTLAPALRAAVSVTPLAPVVIESNGAAPDRITLYSGSSMTGTGTLRVMAATSGGHIDVDRVPYGFAQNDVIVVAPETIGGNCEVAQISGITQSPQPSLAIANGSAQRFNPSALGTTYKAGLTRVFNLGPAKTLSFHSWTVADGFLQLRATDLLGAGASAATVADNIVSIKALYGFDKRNGTGFQPQGGMLVSQWSTSMIDADNDGVVGGAGDYQRITALRVVVVARSKSPERPKPGEACAATAGDAVDTDRYPIVFADKPKDIAAATMKVNLAVAGDPVNWKCYRYRVFESIVPLRNSAWRPTA